MKKKYSLSLVFTLFLLFLTTDVIRAQDGNEDAFAIRKLYDEALTNGQCYDWLYHLCKSVGPRLAGSPQAAASVEYTRQMLDTLGLDTVYLQPCTVPHWVRGKAAQVRLVNHPHLGSIDLSAIALGNTVGTPPGGISADVIEVRSLDEVDSLGRLHIEGKVVFFNRPMNPRQINTFRAYGGAVDQRVFGAERAARHGAVAVVVRSMTTRTDDIPHTGTNVYAPGVDSIPAIALSTIAADQLHNALAHAPARLYLYSDARFLAPQTSYNVIGEVRGSTHPDEIILVGGHLDSWDIGEGAHDDGAGCVQSMEVLRLLKNTGYRPKRTIRCVLFMNEENGLAGAKAYADISNAAKEFHTVAIESDSGGFSPRGFSADAEEEVFATKFRYLNTWLPLLEPYGLKLSKGGSGADINPLKSQGGLLLGLRPDSQRYFDYHHAANDTFEAVNKRELELGAAAMTALVYLIDKYGLPNE